MTERETAKKRIHKFEKAGLGKAPFACVGYYQDVGPKQVDPNNPSVLVGAPGQPMGTCDYCGMGIKHVFVIRSSDGHKFRVGSECVYKTGDACITSEVKQKVNAIKRDAKRERDLARIADAQERLQCPDLCAKLGERPHPHPSMGHLTMMDWVDWMMAHAGISGKIRVCRAIDKL